MQARLNFFKHMTTLCGATIVAAVAVYGAFFEGGNLDWKFSGSLLLVGLDLAFSGVSFAAASQGIGRGPRVGYSWADESVEDLLARNIKAMGVSRWHFLLVVGLWYLAVLGLMVSVRDQF